MAKKSINHTPPALNRNQSEKIQRSILGCSLDSLKSKKNSSIKKSIKKPDKQFQLIEKVELLRGKFQKLYKNAEKKIQKMIKIIEEADLKNLTPYFNQQKSLECSQEHPNSANLSSYEDRLKQKDIISKTLSQIHNIMTYQRPLSYIKNEFQSFYSKLSAFSKQLQSQVELPGDKKFLIPAKGLSFQELRLIEKLIREHYLRIGYFNVAQLFDKYGRQEIKIVSEKQETELKEEMINNSYQQAEEDKQTIKRGKKTQQNSKLKGKKVKAELIDLQQNFKQCFVLRHELMGKKFSRAINWCVQERLYETYSSPLEYELRLTEIRILIKQKKFGMAYQKIQKDMLKFLSGFQQQINQLIGFLMFSCQWNPNKIFNSNQKSNQQDLTFAQITQSEQKLFDHIMATRYAKLSIKSLDLDQLVDKFTNYYFIHYGISKFDTMQICYRVGKMYEETYFNSIKMFSEKDRQEFLKHRDHCELDDKQTGLPHAVVLPFQIPVNNNSLYHSIFVCPVTKEVLSSNDGVQYLSCGHLVSQSAKKSMAEIRRSNHKQKCPVCQKDRASQVVKVRF